MKSTHLQVDVFTPVKPVARVDAKSVLVPGASGYMELLPEHSPLIAELGPGCLRLDKSADGSSLLYFVSGGFIETHENKVTILADVAELVGEIDVSRAEKSVARAKERLAQLAPDLDIERALAAERRGLARVDFVRQQKNP